MRLILYIFSVIVLLSGDRLLGAVDSPSVSCISIEDNNIVIQWQKPNDPALAFTNYNVYFSSSLSANYSLATTINDYNQNSYTYNYPSFSGANAYFYITTSFTGGESLPTDTISPIFLQLDNTQEAVAQLSWNTPSINGLVAYYQIYMRQSGETWQWIDSANTETYTDSIAVCSDSIYYRVELPNNNFGCASVSTISGELFEDKFAPAPPKIDSISVDRLTGYVHIGWNESSEGDIGGYIVALKVGNNWNFDTIWGKSNTHFVDIDAQAYKNIETYGLLAFDTCWSGLPLSPNTSASGVTHSTMLLIGESDACTRSITLNWNEYEGWSDGISEYELYVSENGAPRVLLTELASGTVSYTHDSLIPNANYCYTLVARSGSRMFSSSSNRICITMLVPKLPKNHYLNKVTVINNEAIEVSCFVDNTAAIEYYLIERAESYEGPYEIINQIYPPTDSIISYTDYDIDPASKIYYYKIKAVDVCGYVVNISNTSTNVYASAFSNTTEYKNIIQWNPYSDWDTLGSGVSFYNIYKGYSESSISATPLVNVSSNTNFYEDIIDTDNNNHGEVCYLIEAIEGGGNLLAFKEKSLSNITCIKVEPVLYVPNAFTPNGDRKNEVFQPFVNFVNPNEYTMMIFSRYGSVIFQTSDPNEGWTGDNYPTGVYTYKINYTSAEGTKREKVGSVTLIK